MASAITGGSGEDGGDVSRHVPHAEAATGSEQGAGQAGQQPHAVAVRAKDYDATTSHEVTIRISPGELEDRRSILAIKRTMLSGDLAERANRQLYRLPRMVATSELAGPFYELTQLLAEINLTLWRTEDQLRAFEAKGSFGTEFIGAARNVYRYNDQRARVKRQIDELFGFTDSEVKGYTTYAK